MKDTTRSGTPLYQFLDDLARDPSAPVPDHVDPEIAAFARALALTGKSIQAPPDYTRAAQTRVWERVMSSVRSGEAVGDPSGELPEAQAKRPAQKVGFRWRHLPFSTGGADKRPLIAARRMNVSVPMAMIVILGLALVSLELITNNNGWRLSLGTNASSDFVPAGKVRHIVISKVAEPMTGTIEFWYANGPNNLLQRARWLDYGVSGAGNGKPKTAEGWVVDGKTYVMIPADKVVLWTPGTFPAYLAPDPNHPNIISNMLQQPNARIISDTVMDGRNVVVIGVASPSEDDQTWIDKDTQRPFQWRYVLKQGPGRNDITTEKLVVYELMDANTLPPDFFKFTLPEGYKLVERQIPTPTPTAVSTPTATRIP